MVGRISVRAGGLLAALAVSGSAAAYAAGPVRISQDVLRDKIRGGWAGQVIGCTFGGPTEFRFQDTFIQDYQPLTWDATRIPWWFKNAPGLYDDVYMDLTFVEVFRARGLDAPAKAFAKAFAEAPYPLWHANQMGRYNILHGLEPPKSGQWLNNPHADDIDFQIEADFAGLMAPGLPGAAAEICDRIGHIMNSGDGWYGGVYVAAMYAVAFLSDRPETIASEALKAIPADTTFHAVMADVIRWHAENPKDWKETWFRVEKKYSEDIGCPDGVFSPFNIDAKTNAAWVLIGLLFGDGDFGRTVDIAARCGDDSDCNPATAGGILGAALGFSKIPAEWRAGLGEVEGVTFPYTKVTLKEVYDLSFSQALEVIKRNGGRVTDAEVVVNTADVRPVRREVNFTDLRPVERRALSRKLDAEIALDFEGTAVVVTGESLKSGAGESVRKMEVLLDGRSQGTVELPTDYRLRRDPLAWVYGLAPGKHQLMLRLPHAADRGFVRLGDAVIYRSAKGR